MPLQFSIDFSNWTPTELQDWSREVCKQYNKTTNQNLEFIEEDLTKMNMGFSNMPFKETEWKNKQKDTDEIN